MAIYSNFTIDQGATFSADIDVTDADGDALNLTGYTVAGQMRKSYNSTTFTAFSSSVSNATGGVVNITLSASQTGALKAGRYVYDVEITASDATVTRVIEGQIEVTPGVTRA
tara:strand:+ start:274 stop:609 length:336 start_codon:yes stop_codon:yes gene_type:complete